MNFCFFSPNYIHNNCQFFFNYRNFFIYNQYFFTALIHESYWPNIPYTICFTNYSFPMVLDQFVILITPLFTVQVPIDLLSTQLFFNNFYSNAYSNYSNDLLDSFKFTRLTSSLTVLGSNGFENTQHPFFLDHSISNFSW